MWREGGGCEGQPKGELLFPVYRIPCLTPVLEAAEMHPAGPVEKEPVHERQQDTALGRQAPHPEK